MQKFKELFKKQFSAIAMVHLGALPGTPLYEGSIQKLVDNACKEAETYTKYNLDGILIENMNDVPYIQSQHFRPETVASMSRISTEIKKIISKNIPCGIQVLACGNKEAIAIAKACDLNFVRVEGYVFGHVADEGFTDANAGELLRYRRSIHADNIMVFTDIKKKHSSHFITSDVSLLDTAKAAEFFLSDGVILTGTSTGNPADASELYILKNSMKIPIIIGSGVTDENLKCYAKANGVIVGSYFKKNGLWSNDLDEERIKRFMENLIKIKST